MAIEKPDTKESFRYDATTIWLHWLTGVLVILLWCLGQTIDWFPRGSPRTIIRSLHVSFGILLGVILCWRIWWRWFSGRTLPSADFGYFRVLSRIVHFLLYATLVATVALGIANVWVRGDTIFNVITVPAFDPSNKVLRAQIGDLHGLLANTLLALAGFHAIVGVYHHVVRKDNVLRRMLPGNL